MLYIKNMYVYKYIYMKVGSVILVEVDLHWPEVVQNIVILLCVWDKQLELQLW